MRGNGGLADEQLIGGPGDAAQPCHNPENMKRIKAVTLTHKQILIFDFSIIVFAL
jgi:hypothetical protein